MQSDLELELEPAEGIDDSPRRVLIIEDDASQREVLSLRLAQQGFDVCRRLDEGSSICHIPVILLSGIDRPDMVRASHAAGCHFYVRKPYDPNALLALIQQAIRESQKF